MSNCEEKGTCSTHAASSECCPVEKSLQSCCCPIEAAAEGWQKSFFCAMKEAQKDILKEKIRKAWGPTMEKIADATIEAMGAHWQSLLTQGKAQVDLRDAIKKAFTEKK